MDLLHAFIWFGFGTIFGSFLNVLILRYHSGRNLSGRSHCASCNKTLTYKELIPILSFLSLRGHCGSCGSKVSYQYPLVEILSGLLFVFVASLALSIFSTIVLITIFWLLLFISVYDFHHTIVPNEAASLTAILSLIFSVGLMGNPFFSQILYGLFLALPFYVLWRVSDGRWMGLGDAKITLSIGFLLGLSGGLSAVILSFWIGAVFSLLLLFINWQRKFRLMRNSKLKLSLRVRTMGVEVPFVPFMAFSTFIVFFFKVDVFNLVLF
ncbi:MAG: prepilin peptidase [Parcubacteria group bacterium]|nr:prepilin peptidase [Parcubacteria group bacterium]